MNALLNENAFETNEDNTTRTTTLFDLISRMQEDSTADTDKRITPTVQRLFESGHIRFLDKMALMN